MGKQHIVGIDTRNKQRMADRQQMLNAAMDMMAVKGWAGVKAEVRHVHIPVLAEPNLGDILRGDMQKQQDRIDNFGAVLSHKLHIIDTSAMEIELRRRMHIRGKKLVVADLERPSVFKHSEHFCTWLEDRGYERLGGGHFSTVYYHPSNPTRCLKVSKTRDGRAEMADDWPIFAAYAQSVNSPHLIKVYNIKRYSTFYVASMERLDTIASHAYRGGKAVRDASVTAVVAMQEFKYSAARIQPETNIHVVAENAKIRFINKVWPRMLSTLRLLNMRDLITDLHDDNWGYRADGTPVIFDPCVSVSDKRLSSKYANMRRYKSGKVTA